MRLIVPLERAAVHKRLASLRDGAVVPDLTGSVSLYAFDRPYGYDISPIDNPEPLAHPVAKVRVLERGGFAELNVRFRSDSLIATTAWFLLSLFLAWGQYFYDGELRWSSLLAVGFSLAGVGLAVILYHRLEGLRRGLRALFPEARPAV